MVNHRTDEKDSRYKNVNIYITNTLIKQGNGIDTKFEKLSNI